jgi:hypothetical protein
VTFERILSWIVLVLGLLTASATVVFVAAMIVTGPVHGPVIEPVALGAAASIGLVWWSRRLRREAKADDDRAG